MRWPVVLLALAGLAALVTGAQAHGSHAHAVTEAITRISDGVPDLDLIDRTGRPVRSATVLRDPGRTVVVTFTYTRCKTLCPVVVPMAIDVVGELRRGGVPVRLVVFTVDPANDRPADLAEHAAALGAADDDLFVTGEVADVRRILRFFGLASDDPERHPPLILARRPGEAGFTRMIVGDRTTTGRLGAVIRGDGN